VLQLRLGARVVRKALQVNDWRIECDGGCGAEISAKLPLSDEQIQGALINAARALRWRVTSVLGPKYVRHYCPDCTDERLP
jgi:hypothetical protein